MPYYVEEEDKQGRKRLVPKPTGAERLLSKVIIGTALLLLLGAIWLGLSIP